MFMKNSTKHSISGSSLLAVMFVITVMALMLGAVYTITTGEARFMKRSVDRAIAVAYADGVLESLYDQWRMAMAQTQDPTQRSQGFSNEELSTLLTTPSLSQLPPPSGMSLASWNVQAADPYLAPQAGSASRPVIEAGTESRLRIRMYYLASTTVNFPGGTVTAQRRFTRSGHNIFDNFLFSIRPVTEIHPGPPMYVSGKIYAGGDLYMAHSSLHLQQDVSYTGSMTLDYKGGPLTNETSTYWDSRYGVNTPSITSSAWPANDPPHVGPQQKLFDTPLSNLDPNFIDDPSDNNVNNTDPSKGPVNPNDNGFGEIVKKVTDSSQPDPLQTDSIGGSERMFNNADYRIYVDAGNNVTIARPDSSNRNNDILVTSGADYNAIMSAITTNTTLYNSRESDNVRVVNLDVGKLNTAFASKTAGLILYVQDTSVGTQVTTKGFSGYTTTTTGNGNLTTTGTGSVTSSRARGIRLVNGGEVPSKGFTVASPNPVYIQGDFNTGTKTNYSTSTTSTAGTLTVTNQPPSNTSNAYPTDTSAPSEISGSYAKGAVAVIADAVNILSNKWSDANSPLALSSRVAGNTTINAAILAGNVPTTRASYSGGVENFPRFLESWGAGYYFTLHGSLGLLFDSAQATGRWSGASYVPPNRRWFFDTIFLNQNPPGFQSAYSYSRGKWGLR